MSSRPVACLGDMHVCPGIGAGPRPHVGGPVVQPGQAFVRINGRPVAVVTGSCICTGIPCPDKHVQGSQLVRISGKAVMRIGDKTAHQGVITTGAPTVRFA